jgi:hypothetical protein
LILQELKKTDNIIDTKQTRIIFRDCVKILLISFK